MADTCQKGVDVLVQALERARDAESRLEEHGKRISEIESQIGDGAAGSGADSVGGTGGNGGSVASVDDTRLKARVAFLRFLERLVSSGCPSLILLSMCCFIFKN